VPDSFTVVTRLSSRRSGSQGRDAVPIILRRPRATVPRKDLAQTSRERFGNSYRITSQFGSNQCSKNQHLGTGADVVVICWIWGFRSPLQEFLNDRGLFPNGRKHTKELRIYRWECNGDPSTTTIKLPFLNSCAAGGGAASWFTAVGLKHARALQHIQAAVVR